MNPAENNTNINPGGGALSGFGPDPAAGGFSAGGLGGTGNGMGSATSSPTSSQADDSAVTTDNSTEKATPFVPASPVPGSIGSVTSGPALGSTNLAAAVAPSGADGSSAFTPVNEANPVMPTVGGDLNAQMVNETPAAPAFNPFAPATPEANAPANATADGATLGQETMQNGMVQDQNTAMRQNAMPGQGGVPGQNMAPGNAAPGQGAMPSPFQARMDSLAAKSAKTAKGGSNILTIIFAGIGAVAIVAAIVFCVLWIQAVNNPEIRYIPSPAVSGNTSESTLTCTRMYGGADVPGMEGLINEEANLTLKFEGDEWKSSGLFATYNFADAASAEAANSGIFAAMISSSALSNDAGDVIVSTSSQPIENRVEYREDTDISVMDGSMADGRDIPRTDDGSIQKNKTEVQNYYAEQGWTCQ